MINDLLYLAKAEANKIQLHIEQIKVDEICDAVMASFSEITREKNIKVQLEVQRDMPTLVTDAGKIQQILENYMSNAVKFTPAAGHNNAKRCDAR